MWPFLHVNCFQLQSGAKTRLNENAIFSFIVWFRYNSNSLAIERILYWCYPAQKEFLQQNKILVAGNTEFVTLDVLLNLELKLFLFDFMLIWWM